MNDKDSITINGDVTNEIIIGMQKLIEPAQIKPGKILNTANFSPSIETIVPLVSALTAVLGFLLNVMKYRMDKKNDKKTKLNNINYFFSLYNVKDFHVEMLKDVDAFIDEKKIEACSVKIKDAPMNETYIISIDKSSAVDIKKLKL
jgi:hypothetical protein